MYKSQLRTLGAQRDVPQGGGSERASAPCQLMLTTGSGMGTDRPGPSPPC